MSVCYPNNMYLCESADRYGVMTYRQEDAYASSAFLYRRHNIKVGNMEQEEIWKPVVGYEGLYEVSNLGRVRSLRRTVEYSDGRVFTYQPKILVCTAHNKGYLMVRLRKNKITKSYLVHRLVALTFIPNPQNKPEIDHINTIRTENCVNNLRWVSRKENCANEITHKRMSNNSNSVEIRQKQLSTRIKNKTLNAPKRVYQFSIDGEFIAEYESCHDASRKTGICEIGISVVARGGRHAKNEKSAGGYLWSYDKNNHPTYEIKSHINRYRPVYQYSTDFELIRKWDYAYKASKELGCISSNIINSAKSNLSKKYKGFYWSFSLI